MHTAGNIYIESGSPTEAILWYERCYKNRQQLYGPEHTSTISVLSSLSHTYLTINDYTNAESSFINLCNLRKAVLGLGQFSIVYALYIIDIICICYICVFRSVHLLYSISCMYLILFVMHTLLYSVIFCLYSICVIYSICYTHSVYVF